MTKNYSITIFGERKRGQHLGAEERGAIQALKKLGCSNRAIARAINCSPSTVGYELKRGSSYGASSMVSISPRCFAVSQQITAVNLQTFRLTSAMAQKSILHILTHLGNVRSTNAQTAFYEDSFQRANPFTITVMSRFLHLLMKSMLCPENVWIISLPRNCLKNSLTEFTRYNLADLYSTQVFNLLLQFSK